MERTSSAQPPPTPAPATPPPGSSSVWGYLPGASLLGFGSPPPAASAAAQNSEYSIRFGTAAIQSLSDERLLAVVNAVLDRVLQQQPAEPPAAASSATATAAPVSQTPDPIERIAVAVATAITPQVIPAILDRLLPQSPPESLAAVAAPQGPSTLETVTRVATQTAITAAFDRFLGPQIDEAPHASAAAGSSTATPPASLLQRFLTALSTMQGSNPIYELGLLGILNHLLSEVNVPADRSKLRIDEGAKERLREALAGSIEMIQTHIADPQESINRVAQKISTRLQDFHILLFDFIDIQSLLPSAQRQGPSVQENLQRGLDATQPPDSAPLSERQLKEEIPKLAIKIAEAASTKALYEATRYFIGSKCPEIHQFVTRDPTRKTFPDLKAALVTHLTNDSELNPVRKFFIQYFVIPFVSYFVPSFIEKITLNIKSYIEEIIHERQRNPAKAFEPDPFNRGRNGTRMIINAFEAYAKGERLYDENNEVICLDTPLEYVAKKLGNTFNYSRWLRSITYQFIPKLSFSGPLNLAIASLYKWSMNQDTTRAKIFLSLITFPFIIGLSLIKWTLILPITTPLNLLFRFFISWRLNQTPYIKKLRNKNFDTADKRKFAETVDQLLSDLFKLLAANLSRTSKPASRGEPVTPAKQAKKPYPDLLKDSSGFFTSLLKAAKLSSKDNIDEVKAALSPASSQSEIFSFLGEAKELGQRHANSHLVNGGADMVATLLRDTFTSPSSEFYFYTILTGINNLLMIQPPPFLEAIESAPQATTASTDVDTHQRALLSQIVNTTVDQIEGDLGKKQRTISENYIGLIKHLFEGPPTVRPSPLLGVEGPPSPRPTTNMAACVQPVQPNSPLVTTRASATSVASAAPEPESRITRLSSWKSDLREISREGSSSEDILSRFLLLYTDITSVNKTWSAESTALTNNRVGTNITNKTDIQLLSSKFLMFINHMIALRKDLLLLHFPQDSRIAIDTIIDAINNIASLCGTPPDFGLESKTYEERVNQLKVAINDHAKRISNPAKSTDSLRVLQGHFNRGSCEESTFSIMHKLELQLGLFYNINEYLDQLITAKKDKSQEKATALTRSLGEAKQILERLAADSNALRAQIDSEKGTVSQRTIQDKVAACLATFEGEEGLEVLARAIRGVDYIGYSPVETTLVTDMAKWGFTMVLSKEIAQIRNAIKEPALLATIGEQMFLKPMIK